MFNKSIVSVLLIGAFIAGAVFGPGLLTRPAGAPEAAEEAEAEEKILYWVAPMDPNFRRDGPGKSPMGMDLVPVYEQDGAAEDGVTISAAVENNLGVRTQAAEVRPLWRRIEATGFVGFDETRISHINTRVAGWIVTLKADAEGERLNRGDLLFEFYSPELVNAQKEYLQAIDSGQPRLRAGGREKLRFLGMIPEQIGELERRGTASETISVVAPQDGIVASLGVREGMYVQTNTPIMSLVDLSVVWLQAQVFESQAGWVAPGQAVKAELEYLPGREFSGQVDYVYPVLDPETRTLPVRLRFENPGELLKPNMYARVSIYGRLKPNALSIPREALIPAPGKDRVVVSSGNGRFEVHEVLTGLESGAFVEILAGISEGDRVVTSAQFLIDSEASLSGSIKRLESVDPLPEQRDPGSVFASGWVDGVNREARQVRVSHGPIEALGWPSMTMIFDVKPSVVLDGIEAGQGIRFALIQEHAGEYVIEQIFSGSEDGPEMTEVPSDTGGEDRD